ncbi:ATP-binding protein [Rhodocytophaga aerolata]|uniref:ATP-binding protein n=1 Tax=Rhodocytophaga aerolata TaxID=455078 RepID=A0ABT8RAI1_9BACT|nr:ATP-binding protein [Rhodocytophaga aerolata]MDO1449106.1 ATP-binding protein [Rhodocytophaga aerolata]
MKTQFFASALLLSCLFTNATLPPTSYQGKATLTKKWETEAVLNVPESVLYDQKQNVLYVSNIVGKPGDKDGNGFISKVSLNGKVENLEWVKGLDAPKGMGVYNNKLYIADLTKVLVVNTANGAVLKTIDVPGASFLNDVTVDSKGVVYVSDSDTKKIFRVQNDKVELWMENKDLKKPNGLLAMGNDLAMLDMDADGAFYKISTKDKKMTKFAEGVSSGDGVVMVGKDEYLVSNWNGEVSYINSKGEKQVLLDTKEQKVNAADIEYIASQNLLLVPTFFDNKVMAYEFKK